MLCYGGDLLFLRINAKIPQEELRYVMMGVWLVGRHDCIDANIWLREIKIISKKPAVHSLSPAVTAYSCYLNDVIVY